MSSASLCSTHCAIRCARRSTAATSVGDFPVPDEWQQAEAHLLSLWSGAPDPLAASRGPSTARLLWSEHALYLRAEITFDVPCLDESSPTNEKRHGLWELDVVELFCSRGAEATPYGEVEGAPTGHWLDYFIIEPRRVVDRQWRSGAMVRGRLGAPAPDRFTVEIALPWRGLGAAPQKGAVLRANVYAAQGLPDARRFLALCPTKTAQPDFHVPERFAHLHLD